MRKIAILFAIIMFNINLIAQTPESFKYQSVIRNSSGEVLANQLIGFQMSILQGSSTGTVVYSETFTQTTNQFGLVNLNIGEGNTTDNFSAIDWSTGTYFLKVSIDETGSTNYVEIGTSKLNSVPYAFYAKDVENNNDADADPENELQNISKTGNTVTLSNGGGSFTDDVNDADFDPTNELQILDFSNDTLYLSNGGQVYLGNYGNLWLTHGNDIYNSNTGYVGVGLDNPMGKLVVKGDATSSDTLPLFEVKNKDGQTIFAVYDGGVRVYVNDDIAKANNEKSGFAVGGYSLNKSLTNEYLRVTPDSVRVYINEDSGTKANNEKGGFAVGGYSLNKNTENNYLFVQDDSTRVLTNGNGGFEIADIASGSSSYMDLTPENYFIGHQAGDSIKTGISNLFLGFNSGISTTGGNNNIFMGHYSGYSNNNCSHNVFVGSETGRFSKNNYGWGAFGSFNAFVGRSAGYNNIGGYSNAFFGDQAGYNNRLSSNYNSILFKQLKYAICLVS